jgi:hypothetical protein
MMGMGQVRLTAAQKAAIKEREQRQTFLEFEPPQKILVCQRGGSFAVNVPTHLQHVFRPASRETEVLQRQLRGRTLKAAQNLKHAVTLPDYQCEYIGSTEDGLYELGELSMFTGFLLREAQMHLNRHVSGSEPRTIDHTR